MNKQYDILYLMHDNPIKVIELINEEYDVNYRFPNYYNMMTILMYAINLSSVTVIDKILSIKKCDINVIDNYNNTALFYCKKINIAKKLINAKININLQNMSGNTSIMEYINCNTFASIEELISTEIDYNITNIKGSNIIMLVENNMFMNNQIQKNIFNAIIDKCLEKGDINVLDNNVECILFYTLLHKKIYKTYYPIIFELLNKQFDEISLFNIIIHYII